MSVKEIWERACEMGSDKERNGGKIPKDSFEIAIREDKEQFYVARKEGGAFFYWLKSREREFPPQEISNAKEEEDDEQSECSDATEKQKISFNERDLHPLLVKFLNEDPNFKLLCKTIYHEKCKKTSAGKALWNYPDIVGVYFPIINIFPTMDIKKKL